MIYTPLRQHPRCCRINKIKVKKKKWENPSGETRLANGLVIGVQSLRESIRWIPYACMSGAMGFMVGIRVVFSVVISPVFGAGIPIVTKLILGFTTTEPPKPHVHHFASSRHNGIVGNSCSCRVISLDGRFGLGPAHVSKGLAMWDHFTSSDEESSKLRFSRGGHDEFDDLCN